MQNAEGGGYYAQAAASSPTASQVNFDTAGLRVSRCITDTGQHMALYYWCSAKSHDVRGHDRISMRPDMASSVAACSVRRWCDAGSQHGTWPGRWLRCWGRHWNKVQRQLIGIIADLVPRLPACAFVSTSQRYWWFYPFSCWVASVIGRMLVLVVPIIKTNRHTTRRRGRIPKHLVCRQNASSQRSKLCYRSRWHAYRPLA